MIKAAKELMLPMPARYTKPMRFLLKTDSLISSWHRTLLMSIDDISPVLAQARRVPKKDGDLFISITHPFTERGAFEGEGGDAPFVIKKSYFGHQPFDATETIDGLTMRFSGWSRPLQDDIRAFQANGLAVISLTEPVLGGPAAGEKQRWARIPLF